MAIKLGIEILKFLKAARNLVKNKDMSKDDILRFAKQEFGEVPGYLRVQIDKLFKSKPTKIEKKGEVVPIKKDEGIMATDEAAEVLEQRTKDIAKGDVTGETSDLVKKIEDKVEEIKKISEDMPQLTDSPFDDFYNYVLGGQKARDPKVGMVRTAAREILEKNKIKIGSEDPIEVLRKTYGENVLEAVDAIGDDLLDAQSYGEINTILKDNNLFDLVPKKTYGYDQNVVAAEKIRKAKELEAKNRQLLEEFDPKDRDPNADGGLINVLKL